MSTFNKNYGVEVLCIGSEILLGNILNSNAKWIAEELALLGLPHFLQSVSGDNLERIKKIVLEICISILILIM